MCGGVFIVVRRCFRYFCIDKLTYRHTCARAYAHANARALETNHIRICFVHQCAKYVEDNSAIYRIRSEIFDMKSIWIAKKAYKILQLKVHTLSKWNVCVYSNRCQKHQLLRSKIHSKRYNKMVNVKKIDKQDKTSNRQFLKRKSWSTKQCALWLIYVCVCFFLSNECVSVRNLSGSSDSVVNTYLKQFSWKFDCFSF